MTNWFDMCTPAARSAFNIGLKEAEQSGSPFVFPEHLLVGLVTEPIGSAGRRLRELDVDVEAVQAAAAARFKVRNPPENPTYLDAEVKQLIVAVAPAGAEPRPTISTGVLLAGLLEEPSGRVGDLLRSLGVDPIAARETELSD